MTLATLFLIVFAISAIAVVGCVIGIRATSRFRGRADLVLFVIALLGLLLFGCSAACSAAGFFWPPR